MKNVHILSPEIVSKIAAGEVIERPASVVKELLENSLDAGATQIEIKLEDAGKKLISIKDNGSGINEDDLETIFHRHATSKIETAEDLFDIHSLGFRGEALYTVAAIGDIVLSSKTKEQDSGWQIHMRGGEKLDLRPTSINGSGTEIEIKELFFNTPARKKFLKSNTTEMHQILNVVVPHALLHQNCRFKLTHQGRDLLDLAPTDDRKVRIADALNLESKHLLQTTYDSKENNVKIQLILGDINIKRSRRDLQYIFVNDRPVQNKNIAFHINQIYRLIMPQDFYPAFAVYINVPTESVDANIHPTKREVKIKNEQQVCSVLRSVTEQLLMTQSRLKQAALSPATSNQQPATEKIIPGKYIRDKAFDQSSRNELLEESKAASSVEDYAYPKQNNQESFIPPKDWFAPNDDSMQSKLENATFVGSFINKFLLYQSGNSLLIMDQHAAAERVTFELLIKQMNKGTVEIQNLLAPVLIKCSPQELLLWEDVQEDLKKCGFENNQWDQETIAVHSYPLLIKDVEKAVREILSGGNIDRSDFETLARRACRSSIMSGDKLGREQCEHLRNQLLECLDPFTCPHGRPTVIEMTEDFLDKQFLRT